jgi:hypothetical protein
MIFIAFMMIAENDKLISAEINIKDAGRGFYRAFYLNREATCLMTQKHLFYQVLKPLMQALLIKGLIFSLKIFSK